MYDTVQIGTSLFDLGLRPYVILRSDIVSQAIDFSRESVTGDAQSNPPIGVQSRRVRVYPILRLSKVG